MTSAMYRNGMIQLDERLVSLITRLSAGTLAEAAANHEELRAISLELQVLIAARDKTLFEGRQQVPV
jgi:hypothetical protein